MSDGPNKPVERRFVYRPDMTGAELLEAFGFREGVDIAIRRGADGETVVTHHQRPGEEPS